MELRKKFILDKKFQLKTSLYIITIIMAVTLIIIGAISINLTRNNKKLNNVITIHNNIFNSLLTYSQADSKTDNQAIKNIYKIHDENITAIQRIIHANNILLFALVVFFVLQGVVVFYILLKRTHRITGPIYVMSCYINRIINGEFPEIRKLRKKDELQEFYSLFSKMVRTLKERYDKPSGD